MKSYSAPSALFEQFESNWSNSIGRIESFVAQVSAGERLQVLRGLLEIEFELLLRKGQPPVIADYVRRFPDAISEVSAALQTVEERLKTGQSRLHAVSRANEEESSCANTNPADAALVVGMLAETVLGEIADEEVEESLAYLASETLGVSSEDALRHIDHALRGERYRRESFHAKGGLGEVYRASDRELNRKVALKQMRPEFADQSRDRARFVLEAKVTGSLEHPGIVPVYGLGEYPDGRPFYAMRFIEGQSLKDAIKAFHGDNGADLQESPPRKPDFRGLEFRKLLGNFVDVCQAVNYAHSRGVLHRDLKPGNVMLGKYGETLVVDWGLAKVQGQTGSSESKKEEPLDPKVGSASGQTIGGTPYGTPAYMSPEQARGEVKGLGAETDVYSLGATLYHLLNGAPPYAHLSFPVVLKQIQDKSLRPPAPIVSGVPRQLTAICQKAMSLNSSERYLNLKDFADDIDRYLADEAVTALGETVVQRSMRWMRKNLLSVIASSATLLLIVTIAVALQSIRLQKRENQLLASDKTLAENKAEREKIQRELSEATAQAAQRDALLSKLTPTRSGSGDTEPRLQLYDNAMNADYVDATVRCDLMLAKYDLLRSVQRIEQANRTLTDANPISELQKLQVLLRKLQGLDSQKERELLAAEILRASELLRPEELAFVNAVINPVRIEKIRLLHEAVSARPDFSAARELLITESLMNGDTSQVYSLSHDGELLFPDDLFYQIAPAIAAAFADDDLNYEIHKNRLTGKLHQVEDQRLLILLEAVRGLSSLAEGWDSGQSFDLNDIVTIASFFQLLSSFEDSSPVISDSLNRMRVNSIDLSGDEDGPLLNMSLGESLLQDSKPFENLMEETEIASPMKNDAFFPFIQGIICIANGQNEEAERVLEDAVTRPSVITRFHKESLYALAMVYRLRYTANKDPEYLRKSGDVFERWLNSSPRMPRTRLAPAVYGCIDAKRFDLARRFVEYARIQLPPDAAEIFCCELLILDHEKNYLRVLELTTKNALDGSRWSFNDENEKFIATMRSNALEKLRLEVGKVLPATDESSN